MAFQPGTSNRTALRVVPESVFGTTPANPVFQNLRYTGESVAFGIKNITSNEIRADRMTTDLIQVGADVSGDIDFELSFDSYKYLLECAFCSTFGAPAVGVSTMKNGVNLKSFTLQKHFQDLATPIFQNFVGCRIGSMKLDFKSGSILTGSFSVMGLNAESSIAQEAGATFVTPGDGMPVMNAVTNLLDIKTDGVVMATKVRSMGFELNNNLRGQEAIGVLGYAGIALGKLEIGGDIELYFENATEYNKFLNSTAFSISFKLLDSVGNSYTFTMPKVKYEEGKLLSGQIDQDLMVQGKWRAIYDPVTQCMIQLDAYDATP